MSVRLNGSTSGYTELDAQASPGNNTLKFPASNGAARQVMRNGATPGTLEFADALVLMTAQNSTSGTSIDFTGIPSWVKRVTVMFNGVSLSGTSSFLLQVGTSGGVVNTGYSGGGARYGGSTIVTASGTTGISPWNITPSATYSGHAIWTFVGANAWTCSLNFGASGGTESGCMAGGSVTLSGTLDRVRITTVNGTDTFDAGTINVMYE